MTDNSAVSLTPRLICGASHVVAIEPATVSCPACGQRVVSTVLVEIDAAGNGGFVVAETSLTLAKTEMTLAPHPCVSHTSDTDETTATMAASRVQSFIRVS
jgi:hypothetical protein